jgi:hypothetical protein
MCLAKISLRLLLDDCFSENTFQKLDSRPLGRLLILSVGEKRPSAAMQILQVNTLPFYLHRTDEQISSLRDLIDLIRTNIRRRKKNQSNVALTQIDAVRKFFER